jgi:hypothetical protein
MRKARQLQFDLPLEDSTRKSHGGSLSRGKRKGRRPLAIKKTHHTVMRSNLATGPKALIKHTKLIEAILSKSAKRFGVKIYRQAICWNHIHLSVKGSSRERLQNFFRVVAGHIAQEILRLYPLKPHEKRTAPDGPQYQRKFWEDLIFTRIVEWGREFKRVCAYIVQNTLEAQGLRPYQPRRKPRNTS